MSSEGEADGVSLAAPEELAAGPEDPQAIPRHKCTVRAPSSPRPLMTLPQRAPEENERCTIAVTSQIDPDSSRGKSSNCTPLDPPDTTCDLFGTRRRPGRGYGSHQEGQAVLEPHAGRSPDTHVRARAQHGGDRLAAMGP
jgi:hypothetical protein